MFGCKCAWRATIQFTGFRKRSKQMACSPAAASPQSNPASCPSSNGRAADQRRCRPVMDSSTRAASILAQLTYRAARLWRSTHGRRRFHRSPGRRETSFCQRFFLRVRLPSVGAFDASGIGASSTLGGLGSDTSGVVTSLASGTASSMAAVGREGMSSQGKIGASAVPLVFPSAISFVMAARSMPAQIDCGRFTSPRFCLISTTKGRCCFIVLSADLGRCECRLGRSHAFVHPPSGILQGFSKTLMS